jgi:hypothetical protein
LSKLHLEGRVVFVEGEVRGGVGGPVKDFKEGLLPTGSLDGALHGVLRTKRKHNVRGLTAGIVRDGGTKSGASGTLPPTKVEWMGLPHCKVQIGAKVLIITGSRR